MNAARKFNKETEVNKEMKTVEEKSWREKMAEELLIADAAAKDKAEEMKAKAIEKEARKASKRAEKEARKAAKRENFQAKVAITAAVLAGAGAIVGGALRHHADSAKENDDKIVDVDFTEVTKENAEEKSEE